FEEISALFRFLKFASTLSVRFSSSSYGIALFSHARRRPASTFSLLKTSRVPSFLTTTRGVTSTRSNVVKRNPQLSHSRRRLIVDISSVWRESITLELLC